MTGERSAPQGRLRVLVVSPYHGGSHASWALGLQRHGEHDVGLLTLPDRFWKWRMHGGAITLARRFLRDACSADVIVATDMLDLTTFLALTRARTAGVPAILYMHENQLTYPLPAEGDTGPMRRQGGERDHHYAFVNLSSMLAADRVVFNSTYHHDAWFEALPRFLRHFPEYNELGIIDGLRDKAAVIPVGIESMEAADRGRTDAAPLLLWNQRWEYDKNPSQLRRALDDVAARGVDFRLAICGQGFGESPPAFDAIERAFADRLVHFGFAEEITYRRLLTEASVTLSTAAHEFFGVAVLEAMAASTFAVLPERLSYPELLGGSGVSAETRRRCLYRTHDGLVDRLAWSLRNPVAAARHAAELADNAQRFAWCRVAPRYDALFEDAASA